MPVTKLRVLVFGGGGKKSYFPPSSADRLLILTIKSFPLHVQSTGLEICLLSSLLLNKVQTTLQMTLGTLILADEHIIYISLF